MRRGLPRQRANEVYVCNIGTGTSYIRLAERAVCFVHANVVERVRLMIVKDNEICTYVERKRERERDKKRGETTRDRERDRERRRETEK